MKCKKEWMRLYAVTDRAWAVRQISEKADHESQERHRPGSQAEEMVPERHRPGSQAEEMVPEEHRPGSQAEEMVPEEHRPGSQAEETVPGEHRLESQVEAAIRGGVTCVQLREKNLPREKFLAEAVHMAEICRRNHVPFIINDDAEIAARSGADGVHVGQDDMAISEVRRIVGPDKIIGVSAHTVEEAVEAEKNGADYLGVGSAFSTFTKANVRALSVETLRDICGAVDIPVVAIGGITKENAMQLKGGGVDGIAVVSAIFAAEDCERAAAELRKLAESVSR